jgi:hypothetical protein
MTGDQRTLLKHLIDQARRAKLDNSTGCAGCGTALDNHTNGCATCAERKRKRANRKNNPIYPSGRCRGCGQRYYETTPGCETCYERHRMRERVRRLAGV